MEQGWTAGDVLWDVPVAVDAVGRSLCRLTTMAGTGPLLLRDAWLTLQYPANQLIRDIGVSDDRHA